MLAQLGYKDFKSHLLDGLYCWRHPRSGGRWRALVMARVIFELRHSCLQALMESRVILSALSSVVLLSCLSWARRGRAQSGVSTVYDDACKNDVTGVSLHVPPGQVSGVVSRRALCLKMRQQTRDAIKQSAARTWTVPTDHQLSTRMGRVDARRHLKERRGVDEASPFALSHSDARASYRD